MAATCTIAYTSCGRKLGSSQAAAVWIARGIARETMALTASDWQQAERPLCRQAEAHSVLTLRGDTVHMKRVFAHKVMKYLGDSEETLRKVLFLMVCECGEVLLTTTAGQVHHWVHQCENKTTANTHLMLIERCQWCCSMFDFCSECVEAHKSCNTCPMLHTVRQTWRRLLRLMLRWCKDTGGRLVSTNEVMRIARTLAQLSLPCSTADSSAAPRQQPQQQPQARPRRRAQKRKR